MRIRLKHRVGGPTSGQTGVATRVMRGRGAGLHVGTLLTRFVGSRCRVRGMHPCSPNRRRVLEVCRSAILGDIRRVPRSVDTILGGFERDSLGGHPAGSRFLHCGL